MKSVAYPIYNIKHFQNRAVPSNFYVRPAAEHLKQFSQLTHVHRHDHYVVILCTSGDSIHEIDFIDYRSEPGTLFLLAPGHAHRYKTLSDPQGYVLYHDDAFYELNLPGKKLREYPFFCSGLNVPFIKLEGEDLKTVEGIFSALMKENALDQILKDRLLSNYVDNLYIYLTRHYVPDKKVKSHKKNYLDALYRLEELIEENYKSQRQPVSYARMMKMSTKHLNRICKATVNKTTSELIMMRLMLEAKRMLITSSSTPEMVSIELGYFDQAHFNKMFKKSEGVTPLQFVSDYWKKNHALSGSLEQVAPAAMFGKKRNKENLTTVE
jgi:AraC family transcriptional activator of pobA